MIEDKKLGLKIAESPRDKLIQESIDNTQERIAHLELDLELLKNGLVYLKKQVK